MLNNYVHQALYLSLQKNVKMSVAVQINPNKRLYVKDPQQTKLGRSIIGKSISMMLELGFEGFTFKKLALEIGASEMSVYRYFENKHKLLLYLLSWYWEWSKYCVLTNTRNITDPIEKLDLAIQTLIFPNKTEPLVAYINKLELFRLVIEESWKAYHTKDVDTENKEGFFLTMKALNKEIALLITAVNPNFAYPHALANTILEMSKNLIYDAYHLPSLGDVSNQDQVNEEVYSYLKTLTFKVLSV